MEIVIIGGIAAGMSAAAKARRTNKEANITVIEQENYISFGACGLPYYLGGQFDDEKEMFARTPEQISASGIDLMLEHVVTDVDFDHKVLHMMDKKTNKEATKNYDRLMIATGATPIMPKITGVDARNVYTFTKLDQVAALKKDLVNYQDIVVIGGGFIGVEVADQLKLLHKNITIIEAKSDIMSTVFDTEFSQKLTEGLIEEGIQVKTGEMAQTFTTDASVVTAVVTDQSVYKADAVIIAIGFSPNTNFLGDKLEKLANGAIVIDAYGETNVKDVYAAGDCATIEHRQAGTIYLPLATVANKMGRIVGVNIAKPRDERIKHVGVLSSSAIKAGQYEAASTGLTETGALALNLNVSTTCITASNHSNYYRGREKLTIKLVYDRHTHVLYGAQLFGKNETVLRATGLTTAIHAGMTTEELGFVDYAYAPPFASTWEPINVSANTAK